MKDVSRWKLSLRIPQTLTRWMHIDISNPWAAVDGEFQNFETPYFSAANCASSPNS